MSNRFFISDTHFDHDEIILYEKRPFKDTDEMNKTLINNWNSTVKDDDKVFHLGDVSFTNQEKTRQIIMQLSGYKILIMGGHDKGHSRKWWLDAGFDEVIKYPIIIDQFYMCSHEPLYLNSSMPYVNIHGHTHSTKLDNMQYFNACVECNGYIPINFNKIKERYKLKEGECKIDRN